MSFGFSAGDFIAAAKLIGDIVSCLKLVGGAATEYQELERQLFALERALDEIEHLRVPESQQSGANGIKVAALQCRYVLEDYAGKFKKYGDTLSCPSTTGGVLRGVKRKLQFGLGMRKEAQELRIYILVHLGALNARLLSLGLTSMSIMSDDTKTLHANQECRIGEAAQAMQTMQTSQGVALQETKSMLEQMLDLLQTNVVIHQDQIKDLATKVDTSQRQISSFLLKLGTELPHPDISHTWFQRPCRLEDPLGKHYPIPSEYSYTQMLAVVLANFQSGPGSKRIQNGDYEIANSRNFTQVVDKETFTALIPGMFLTMAVILPELPASIESCPIPSCGSRTYSDCRGGGKICSECGTSFAFESGKRVRVVEVEERRVSKRRKIEAQVSRERTDEEDFEVFKNIRLGRFDLSKPSNEEPGGEIPQVMSQAAKETSDSASSALLEAGKAEFRNMDIPIQLGPMRIDTLPIDWEGPPPPLPPPKYIEELTKGNDPGWQWSNRKGTDPFIALAPREPSHYSRFRDSVPISSTYITQN